MVDTKERTAAMKTVYLDRSQAIEKCLDVNATRPNGEPLYEVHPVVGGGWQIKRTMFYG